MAENWDQAKYINQFMELWVLFKQHQLWLESVEKQALNNQTDVVKIVYPAEIDRLQANVTRMLDDLQKSYPKLVNPKKYLIAPSKDDLLLIETITYSDYLNRLKVYRTQFIELLKYYNAAKRPYIRDNYKWLIALMGVALVIYITIKIDFFVTQYIYVAGESALISHNYPVAIYAFHYTEFRDYQSSESLELLKQSYVERAKQLIRDGVDHLIVRSMIKPITNYPPHSSAISREGLSLYYDTYYNLAEIALAENDYETARVEFTELIDIIAQIEQHDTKADVRYKELQKLLYESYYLSAQSELDNSQWENARNLLDILFTEIVLFDDAEDKVRDLYRDTYYNPAELAILSEAYATALPLLDEVVKLDGSNYRQTLSYLQLTYYSLGSESLVTAHSLEGIAREEALDKAINLLQLLEQINPSYSDASTLLMEAYYLRATIFSENKKWEQAQQLWELVYKLNPSYADTETQLRLAYYIPASETLSKALAKLDNVPITDEELNEVTESCKLVRTALSDNIASLSLLDFRDTRSLIYETIYCEIQVALLNRDFNHAINSLEELNNLSPYYRNTPAIYNEVLYGLAQQQIASNEWEEARTTLSRLLTNEPFYSDAPSLYRDSYFIPAQMAFDAEDWTSSRLHLIPLVYGIPIEGLSAIDPSYRDAQTLFYETYYKPGIQAFDAGRWEEARQYLLGLIEGETFEEFGLSPDDIIAPKYRETQRLLRDSYYIPGLSAFESEIWDSASDNFEGLLELIVRISDSPYDKVDYGNVNRGRNTRLLLQEALYYSAVDMLESADYLQARIQVNRLLAWVVRLNPSDDRITTTNVDYIPQQTTADEFHTARTLLYDTYYYLADTELEQANWTVARTEFEALFDVIAESEDIPINQANHRNARHLYYDSYYQPALIAFQESNWTLARTEFEALFDVIAESEDIPTNQANHRNARHLYYNSYYQPSLIAFQENDWQTTRQEANALITLISVAESIAPNNVYYNSFEQVGSSKVEEIDGISEDIMDIQEILKESYYIPSKIAIDHQNWLVARENLEELLQIDQNYKDARTLLQQTYMEPSKLAIGREDWIVARTNLIELLSVYIDHKEALAMIVDAHLIPAQNAFEQEDWQTVRDHILPLVNPSQISHLPIYSNVRQTLDEYTQQKIDDLYRQSFLRPINNLIATADYGSARDALTLFHQVYPQENDLYKELLISTYEVPLQTAILSEDWITASELFLALVAHNPEDARLSLLLSEHLFLRTALAKRTLPYWSSLDYSNYSAELPQIGYAVNAIDIAPFGQVMAYVTSDGLLVIKPISNIVDITNELIVRTSGGRLDKVTLHPRGDWVAVIMQNGNIGVWDTSTGILLGEIDTEFPVLAIAVTPNGQLVTGDEIGNLVVWTFVGSGFQKEFEYTFHDPITALATVNEDIALIGGSQKDIKIVNIQTGEVKIAIDAGYWVTSIEPHPTNKTFVVTGLSSKITHWTLEGEEIAVYTPHLDWIREVAFSSDGSLLFSVGDDQRMSVLDLQRGVTVAYTTFTDEHPLTIAVTPDNRTIYVGGGTTTDTTTPSGFVWLWDWKNIDEHVLVEE